MKKNFIINHDVKISIFKKAILARFVEENLLDLFSRNKIFGTLHTCIGQEMAAAVLSEHLRQGDMIFTGHRGHGHFLARNGNAYGLIAEVMGKKTGVCGGLGGSQHLYQDGFFSNGIQGGNIPISAGVAMAKKLSSDSEISVVVIGDGTLGTGVLYETMNIASLWHLPILFVLEDNMYAQSTPKNQALAGSIQQRAESFGIEFQQASTWEWEDLYHKTNDIISAMRTDRRPRFLHIETYRLRAHSKGDDFRPLEEVHSYEEKDPVHLFLKNSSEANKSWIEQIKDNLKKTIDKVIQDQEAQLPAQNQKTDKNETTWRPYSIPSQSTSMSRHLNAVFKEMLESNKKILFLGEDIEAPYGGAFHLTSDLSKSFPERVLNTPISEAAIVGIGTGLALCGFFPIVEIMFGDFLPLAMDQIINHAAKFEQMYNGKIKVNLTVRTPMGGHRGYGPTHSQTLEKHFLGVPGLKILALNSLIEPKLIYENLAREQRESGPVLVLENKTMYSENLLQKVPEGFQLLIENQPNSPAVYVKPESDHIDVTLFGYGGVSTMLIQALEVLFENDIIAQILCPTKIYPFSVHNYRTIFSKAENIVIVEEGQVFASLGAELITQLLEAKSIANKKIRRIGPAEYCIPASVSLENKLLPSVSNILKTCLDLKKCQI